MKFTADMVLIGLEWRKSKKSGNEYVLVKLADEQSQIYEMYVPDKNTELIGACQKIAPFSPVQAGFEVASFNNKPQIDLKAIKGHKKDK